MNYLILIPARPNFYKLTQRYNNLKLIQIFAVPVLTGNAPEPACFHVSLVYLSL
jgi:hypothetical protein